MIIDAHQHFWTLDRGDYGWLSAENVKLYRDFVPRDLEPILNALGIDGTVLVQAAPSAQETAYLLTLADAHAFILGIVGWVDFEASDVGAQISKLSKHPKLVGLRPMIQDIANDDWMISSDLSPAFEAMIANQLVFDALVLPKHLPNLLTLLSRFPALKAVIDHAAKPDIASGAFNDWAQNMSRIARDTSASVKLSGLVNEAGPHWTVASLKPFVDHLLTQFGPNRLIWGSDWPVATMVSTYDAWWKATQHLLDDLDATARHAILGGNAAQLYKLQGAI